MGNSTIKQKQPKAKKCLCPCGEMFVPTSMGQKHINQSHYIKWLSETEAGQKEVAKKMEKAKKQVAKVEREDTVKKKTELKTLAEWKKDLEKEINAICLLIDYGHGCISCGGIYRLQAGHCHSVKSSEVLRYNLHNLWVQNHYCNVELSGNLLKYLEGLNNLLGEQYKNYVQMDIVRMYPSLHLRIDDVRDAIYKARAIKKHLQKDKQVYTTEQRRQMRVDFNQEIGIYSE